MKLSLANLNLMRVTCLAGLAVALLASCGGGDPIERFVPSRIIVFGDEASLIEADTYTPTNGGRKYTVNGVTRDTTTGALTTTRDCTRNPIWVQVLANDYGYQFAECLTTATTAQAFMRAQANSTAAMMRAQIDSYVASPGFTDKDLVTVMVGTHDIVAALGAGSSSAAIAAAEAAGTAVGAQVVRITDRGAKVIVATVPDVGTTPQYIGTADAAMMTTLTTRFNAALRVKLQEVRGGGHSAGLVLGDELVLVMRRSPASYGINGSVPEALTQAACDPAKATFPNCDENDAFLTSQAIATTSHASDWLWAGPLQLGANAQLRLGQAAVYRARNNPF